MRRWRHGTNSLGYDNNATREVCDYFVRQQKIALTARWRRSVFPTSVCRGFPRTQWTKGRKRPRGPELHYPGSYKIIFLYSRVKVRRAGKFCRPSAMIGRRSAAAESSGSRGRPGETPRNCHGHPIWEPFAQWHRFRRAGSAGSPAGSEACRYRLLWIAVQRGLVSRG